MTIELKEVLIIDDEIHGIQFIQAKECASNFFEEYQDINSEISAELDTFFIETCPDQFSQFIPKEREVTSEFLKNVLLTTSFREKAPHLVLEKLKELYEKHDQLLELKKIYQKAFSKVNYNVTFREECPVVDDDLINYNIIIIDLFLSALGQKESIDFLNEIAKFNDLPAIILISSHFNNAESDPVLYFEKTRISAAGLTTLAKNDLLKDEYEGKTLKNLTEVLIKQREISNRVRNYVTSWERAFDEAKKETLATIWKLDSLLLQSIHKDAKQDSQLFKEHLQNFLFREYLWHLEKVPELSQSTEKLDQLFEQMQDGPILWANNVNIDSHRDLLTHYFFKNIEREKIKDTTLPNLEGNLLKYIPFGAVLSGTSQKDIKKVYINITQACDLTSFLRPNKKNNLSLLLMCTDLIETHTNQALPFESSQYKITDFNLNGERYDIKPNPKKLLSFSLDEFYQFAIGENLILEGTLRSDIATGLQQQMVANLIRPSEARSERLALSTGKVYLTIIKDGVPNKLHKDVQILRKKITKKDKHIEYMNILGNENLELPLWVNKTCQFTKEKYCKEVSDYFEGNIFSSKPISLCDGQLEICFKAVKKIDDEHEVSQISEGQKKNKILFLYES